MVNAIPQGLDSNQSLADKSTLGRTLENVNILHSQLRWLLDPCGERGFFLADKCHKKDPISRRVLNNLDEWFCISI
jgi:hypothetical protein